MDGIISFLQGKKTYIVAIATAILAGVSALGYPIPEYVYAILGALGITTIRAAITKP